MPEVRSYGTQKHEDLESHIKTDERTKEFGLAFFLDQVEDFEAQNRYLNNQVNRNFEFSVLFVHNDVFSFTGEENIVDHDHIDNVHSND